MARSRHCNNLNLLEFPLNRVGLGHERACQTFEEFCHRIDGLVPCFLSLLRQSENLALRSDERNTALNVRSLTWWRGDRRAQNEELKARFRIKNSVKASDLRGTKMRQEIRVSLLDMDRSVLLKVSPVKKHFVNVVVLGRHHEFELASIA